MEILRLNSVGKTQIRDFIPAVRVKLCSLLSVELVLMFPTRKSPERVLDQAEKLRYKIDDEG